jgi:glucose-6-phosphate isomerase
MFAPDPVCLTDLPQWAALSRHAHQHAGRTLARRFAENPARFDALSFRLGDVLIDFSRQRIEPDTLALLVDLARTRKLEQGISALASGCAVNHTEHRAAMHMALRAPLDAALTIDGQGVTQSVGATLDQMESFVRALHEGTWKGASGQPIAHVVNLGIGGSDLGPRLVANALAGVSSPRLKVSFVASPDPAALSQALAGSAPHETLFIVSSKSFSTTETYPSDTRCDFSCHKFMSTIFTFMIE